MSGAPSPPLRRVLGLTEVTAGGVGIIIGAGIYVLLGAATAQAGALVWLAFLLAALLSLLTGLSYAELSSMFPSAAGEYEYTRHAMPEWVAFVAVIAVSLVAAAFAAIGEFTVIAAMTDFAIYVVFIAVNATVIILRRTRSTLRRPFAIPGTIRGIPVLPVLGLASVAVMMTQLDPLAIGLGSALCAAGLALGRLLRSVG